MISPVRVMQILISRMMPGQLANNGIYYFEVLGLDETGIIYHQANNTWLEACGKIDAGIFSTGCDDFEVRLKPHDNYPDNVLTNLQFTISWPENNVNLG